jgi:ATP-dependent DNA ligase
MKHPTLYKKSATTGKITQWTVSANGNRIETEWGEVGGKLQDTADVIKEGKNLGRSNATTPEQQAAAEAKAKWEKHLKAGYVKSAADAEAGKTDDIIEGGLFPMLAHRFDKYPDKISWPAYVQPKLDGHRCIAMVDNEGVCTLWSRTRKPITSMPHIVAEIESFGLKDVTLDGELYNHEYAEEFEKLTSMIRPKEPKSGHEIVHYHMYDVVNNEQYSQRHAYLEAMEYQHFIYNGYDGALRNVETILCEDAEAMYAAFDSFLAAGYEGAIVRNAHGVYAQKKRSYDLQKVKKFDDAEFNIVGVVEGRGKLMGHGIFLCETSDGTQFEVKMKGEQAALQDVLENPQKYIGRQLTVQYFGITKKSSVPRFPVGLRLREDI